MKTAERSTKLTEINNDVVKFVQKRNDIIIKNNNDMQSATEYLANIVARKKRIEEIRLSYTRPINETLKNINADFKKALLPLFETEKLVKSKMIDYRNKEAIRIDKERIKEEERLQKIHDREMERQRKKAEKEAEKERKRLEKENLSNKAKQDKLDQIEDEKKAKEEEIDQAKEEYQPETNIQQEKTVHSESGAIRARKVWKFKIIEETKVPKKYLKVDEVKIRQALRNGERDIAGIEIYEEEQIGVY